MAVGSWYPGEGCVLHGWPDLGLIKVYQAIRVILLSRIIWEVSLCATYIDDSWSADKSQPSHQGCLCCLAGKLCHPQTSALPAVASHPLLNVILPWSGISRQQRWLATSLLKSWCPSAAYWWILLHHVSAPSSMYAKGCSHHLRHLLWGWSSRSHWSICSTVWIQGQIPVKQSPELRNWLKYIHSLQPWDFYLLYRWKTIAISLWWLPAALMSHTVKGTSDL